MPTENMLLLTLDLGCIPALGAEAEAEVARCEEAGYRFFTLEEAGDSQGSRARLYQLVREGVVDDPATEGEFMEEGEFSDQLWGPYYWRWAHCQYLTAKEDEWVGLSNLQLPESGAQFGVTVVRRAHRGNGLAHALKLLALHYLQRESVPSVSTRNSAMNEPVLRLNRRLGFRLEP